ncbi:MAG: B12-binding domain-containing radical SAM protein [Brevinematales bacterium]|nr:B12-binding domain-containing radical SAM protein [Brevinematales bacterium]
MSIKYLHILCPPLWEKLPPLGPAYLFSYIKLQKIKVYFYDLNALLHRGAPIEFKKSWTINSLNMREDFFEFFFKNYYEYFEQILNLIEKNNIKVVGFSFFNINKTFCYKTISFIKKFFPDIRVVAGGPEIFSYYVYNLFNYSQIDNFVVGEGEKALLEILQNKGKELTVFESLEEIDFFPTFEEFDLTLYARKKSLPIMLGRGCINKCNFCSERLLTKYYKPKRLDIIAKAIEYYKTRFKVNWLTFYDSMLNANIRIFDDLLDILISNNINWDAQIGIRPDMEEELFLKMKESGCVNLFIGLEAGSDSLLQKMNKNFTTKEAKKFFQMLNKANIHFEVSLIVGYPDETEKEFDETLKFLMDNKDKIPKIAQVSIFRNYPGITARKITPIEENEALKRLDRLVDFLEKNNFNYTRSYINNLV